MHSGAVYQPEAAEAHPLRAFDAMHPTSALRSREVIAASVDVAFCTADRIQANAAAVGLRVELIA